MEGLDTNESKREDDNIRVREKIRVTKDIDIDSLHLAFLQILLSFYITIYVYVQTTYRPDLLTAILYSIFALLLAFLITLVPFLILRDRERRYLLLRFINRLIKPRP